MVVRDNQSKQEMQEMKEQIKEGVVEQMENNTAEQEHGLPYNPGNTKGDALFYTWWRLRERGRSSSAWMDGLRWLGGVTREKLGWLIMIAAVMSLRLNVMFI